MVQNKRQIMRHLELEYLRADLTQFFVGDTIQVHFQIKEGKRERVQVFEGIVISIRGEGIGKTFTVRKISFNVGVERVFPFHSPKISKIVVVQRGKVRRAKLYYLRERQGKSFQVKRLSRQEEKHLESKLSKRKDAGAL